MDRLTCMAKILWSSSSSRTPPPQQFQIEFKFSRICFSQKWVPTTGDNPRRLRTIATPQEADLILNLQDYLLDVHQDTARQLIREKLSTWDRVVDDNHDDSWRRHQQLLIETALEKGTDVARRMPASHDSVCIRVSAINV